MNDHKYNRSIAAKIFNSYTLLIIFIISGLLLFTNKIIEDTYLDTIQESMKNQLHLTEKIISSQDESKINYFVNSIAVSIKQRVTIINEKGIVTADSEVTNISTLDNHYNRPELKISRENGFGTSFRESTTLGKKMVYSAKVTTDKKHYIRLSRPASELEKALLSANRIILSTGLIAFILSLIINIIISKRISFPIKESIAFAEKIATGDFTQRIQNYEENELGILQKSLNKMADNIEKYIHDMNFEKAKLNITLESIGDPIVVIDRKGKIIISNKAFRKHFKLNDSPLNKSYYEVIRGTKLNRKIKKSLNKTKKEKLEYEFQTGNIFDIYISSINDEKTIEGVLVVFHDITEKKKIENIKTDLVGNLSHELKTPIAIIKGYLETIQLNIDNKDILGDFLNKSLVNLDRQNSIINDMLKLNKLETTKDFEIEKIDLNDIINNCISSLTPKIKKKSIEIELKMDKNQFIQLGNKFLTEQILFNLFDNAINYNFEKGKIKIYLKESSNDNFTNLVIEDSGIGIEDDFLDRIFERFYRVDKGRSRSSGGTGLGLAIVKHSVELQNWQIDVFSKSSGINGTKFVLAMPKN